MIHPSGDRPEPAEYTLDASRVGRSPRPRFVHSRAGAACRHAVGSPAHVDAFAERGCASIDRSARRPWRRHVLRHPRRPGVPRIRGHPAHARRAPHRVTTRVARRVLGRAVPSSERSRACGRGDRRSRHHQCRDGDRVGQPRARPDAGHRRRRGVGDDGWPHGPGLRPGRSLRRDAPVFRHACPGPRGPLAQRREPGARRARTRVQPCASGPCPVRAAPRPCHGRVRGHRASRAHCAMVGCTAPGVCTERPWRCFARRSTL